MAPTSNNTSDAEPPTIARHASENFSLLRCIRLPACSVFSFSGLPAPPVSSHGTGISDVTPHASVNFRIRNGDERDTTPCHPYGVEVEECIVSTGLKHKFSNRWIGHAKVGYIENQNSGTGGRTSSRGPLACLAVEYGR